jgi:beta-N-acetylhexosaminidase
VSDHPAAPGSDDAVLGRLMLAFEGTELPAWTADRLATAPAAGITLFGHVNVSGAAQVRALTDALQAAAPDGLPLLVAADQEGGQLMVLGDGTPFAGNMALGATGDSGLAERVARAIGTELRAVGITVNYAPVCDLASNPDNPGLGARSFGDDPTAAASLAAATVRGLQAAGVAATAKHFPGKGEVSVDTHHELGSVPHDRDRMAAVELVPFRAAFEAGARLVMSGHFAIPAMTGNPSLPATVSSGVMDHLLRDDLGFAGVAISDAIDMKALAQGPTQVVELIAAVRAGVDLLLCTPDRASQEQATEALRLAARRELFEPAALARSAGRIVALRTWAGQGVQPDLDVVGSAAHETLARELAERALTLVRNDAGIVPLQLAPDARVLAVMPRPRNLTPADSSESVAPGLAQALRRRLPSAEEVVTGHPPSADEIAAVRQRATGADLVVVGTINAWFDAAQAELVDALLATGVPVVTVALRVPFDLARYPTAATHLCTYSILPPSLEALVAGLMGEIPFEGRLPAAIPGLVPTGHGLGA